MAVFISGTDVRLCLKNNKVSTHITSLGVSKHDVHMYTKSDIVDITFQIYIPRGTNLKNTRKSTWMNPLINGEEAVKLIGKKGNVIICLENQKKGLKKLNSI